MARKTLAPDSITGWSSDLKVEIDLVERNTIGESLYAIYLDGEIVGWVIGATNYWGKGQSAYTYVMGSDNPGISGHRKNNTQRRNCVERVISAASKAKGN